MMAFIIGASSTSLRNVDIRLGYHARAVEVYAKHPLVISSCFKLAMDMQRRGMADQALHLGNTAPSSVMDASH